VAGAGRWQGKGNSELRRLFLRDCALVPPWEKPNSAADCAIGFPLGTFIKRANCSCAFDARLIFANGATTLQGRIARVPTPQTFGLFSGYDVVVFADF
jgi:hypothetical protein